MPNYRFVFRDSDKVPELTIDLPDDDAAIEEAVRTARQTAADDILEGVDPRDWTIRIFTSGGRLVANIDFNRIAGRPPE